MSMVQIGAAEGIALRLSMPLVGAWTAEGELDGDEAPEGTVPITIAGEEGPPLSFEGTVLEGGAIEGRARLFVVGGRGGLRREIGPQQYQMATPRLIAASILREAGEAEGDLSGLDGLPPLPCWVRQRGTAAEALSLLSKRVGATWRVMRDGSVRIGPETWPPYAGRFYLIGANWAHGDAVAAQNAPDLEPGLLVEGRRVGRVVHLVTEDGTFRTALSFEAGL
jgi:hypothetical protein